MRAKGSYASVVPLEGVDWAPFDISAFVAQGRAQGKPVAVTEFGCATFRGAGAVAEYYGR